MYINIYMTRESDENCILQNMTHIDLCTWCASVNNLFCFSGNEHTVYACIWLGHKRIKINILSFLSCGVCYFMGGGLFKIAFGCFFSFLFVCLFVFYESFLCGDGCMVCNILYFYKEIDVILNHQSFINNTRVDKTI